MAETPEERVARLHREARQSYATGEEARAALTKAAKADARKAGRR